MTGIADTVQAVFVCEVLDGGDADDGHLRQRLTAFKRSMESNLVRLSQDILQALAANIVYGQLRVIAHGDA